MIGPSTTPAKIRALTIDQPWASMIALGYKWIETRTDDRHKSLAGKWVAIHASAKMVSPDAGTLKHLWSDQAKLAFAAEAQGAGTPMQHVLAIAHCREVRVLEQKDMIAAMCNTVATGITMYGICFDRIIRLMPPIQAKGRQGIWWWELPAGYSGILKGDQE